MENGRNIEEKLLKKEIARKILILLPMCLLLVLSGCNVSSRMWDYYSDKGNYVASSGLLTNISIDKTYGTNKVSQGGRHKAFYAFFYIMMD